MRYVVLALWLSAVYAADLEPIKAEKSLEKRSELALQRADESISEAKKAYIAENAKSFKSSIVDVEEFSEFSLQSLEDTGKAARRSPKYFKRAELKLRDLIRRLDSLEKEVAVEDREPVEQAKKRLHALHDQVVLDIMTKK